jgi:hypothetical protein
MQEGYQEAWLLETWMGAPGEAVLWGGELIDILGVSRRVRFHILAELKIKEICNQADQKQTSSAWQQSNPCTRAVSICLIETDKH